MFNVHIQRWHLLCMCMCVRVCMYVCMYVYMHVHGYTHTHTHTHTSVYTCIYVYTNSFKEHVLFLPAILKEKYSVRDRKKRGERVRGWGDRLHWRVQESTSSPTGVGSRRMDKV